MAGTTTKGLRYPTAGDNPAVHTDIQNLATDVDTELDDYVLKSTPSFTSTVELGAGANIIFEGSTNDGFETTLTVADPTADRTITLPNATGTVVLADASQTLSNKTLASPVFTGQVTGLEIGFSQSIVFEGTTADAYELTLSAGEPTSDVTVTLPNETDKLANENFVRTSVLMLGGM
ncbi:MAG: hypothetical protein EBZ61_11645 [Micrococcales bacterium]|nr:hypothetical protein [Micrococcales bacterium]